MIGESKHILITHPSALTASTAGPCPTIIQIRRTPGFETWMTRWMDRWIDVPIGLTLLSVTSSC